MKIWASWIGGSVYYILVENPKKEEWIEINLRLLRQKLGNRLHKRINLKNIFRWSNIDFPNDCYVFDHFPKGYNREWVYEKSIIYIQDLDDILDDIKIGKKC